MVFRVAIVLALLGVACGPMNGGDADSGSNTGRDAAVVLNDAGSTAVDASVETDAGVALDAGIVTSIDGGIAPVDAGTPICTAGSTQACSENHGSGVRTCNVAGTAFGGCVLTACELGYDLGGGVCSPHVPVVKRIALSYLMSCAVVDDQVKCWGQDAYDIFDDVANGLSRNQVSVVFDGGITDFSTRAYREYCRNQNGAVFCTSNESPSSSYFSRRFIDGGATLIESDNFRACAVVSGQLQCWVINPDLPPFFGSQIPTPAPVNDNNIAQVAIGEEICARTADGVLKCWTPPSTGVRTVFTSNVQKVVMNQGGATCALVGSSLYCWATSAASHAFYFRPNGTMGKSLSTAPEMLMNDVLDMGLGTDSTTFTMCATKVGGATSCWGDLDSSTFGADAGSVERTYFASGTREVHVGSRRTVTVGFQDGGYQALRNFDIGDPSVTWVPIDLTH